MTTAEIKLQFMPTLKAWNPDLEKLWGRGAFYALTVGLILNALSAYALGPIPIEWLSRMVFLGSLALMLFSGTLPSVAAFAPLAFLFLWALISTVAGHLDHSITLIVPILSTPYPIFVLLRFINLLAPLGCAYLTLTACERYSFAKVVKFIIWLGTIVALYAIYAYVAEIYGLPEIFRSRMGTGGAAQSTTFTYAFHRALGTFREPSHLAEWLLAPLFTSLAMRNRVVNVHTVVMMVALLLTGSLGGYAGFIGGLLAAAMLANPLRASSWRVLGGILGVVVIGFAGFLIFAAGKNVDFGTLFTVIGDRVGVMMQPGGLGNTDRGDILRAAIKGSITLYGYGFGRANLVLTTMYAANLNNSDHVLSFLSLYLHFLYATGLVGLALMLLFILTPIYLFWSRRLATMRRQYSFLAGGVVAYAVTNALLFDELTPQFAMMVALVITLARAQKKGWPLAPASQTGNRLLTSDTLIGPRVKE
jgi:hypothetical protein